MKCGEISGPQIPTPATPACTLSDVLGTLLENARLSGCIDGQSNLSTRWHIQAKSRTARFYIPSQGNCRLEIDDGNAIFDAVAGDLLVETQGKSHSLCSFVPPHEGTNEQSEAVHKVRSKKKTPFKSERTFATIIHGRFCFETDRAASLLDSLPPVIRVAEPNSSGVTGLADLAGLMIRESESGRVGSHAIVDRLAQVLFIHAVREFAMTAPLKSGNWISAVMDPDIGAALQLMHSQPEQNWTVATLARSIGLSRSVFAARFKALVSKTPWQYLCDYRMQRACSLLAENSHSVKQIAASVGYATDAAFSSAFKQWSGKAPGVFRRLACRDENQN